MMKYLIISIVLLLLQNSGLASFQTRSRHANVFQEYKIDDGIDLESLRQKASANAAIQRQGVTAAPTEEVTTPVITTPKETTTTAPEVTTTTTPAEATTTMPAETTTTTTSAEPSVTTPSPETTIEIIETSQSTKQTDPVTDLTSTVSPTTTVKPAIQGPYNISGIDKWNYTFIEHTSFNMGMNGWDFTGLWLKYDLSKVGPDRPNRPVPLPKPNMAYKEGSRYQFPMADIEGGGSTGGILDGVGDDTLIVKRLPRSLRLNDDDSSNDSSGEINDDGSYSRSDDKSDSRSDGSSSSEEDSSEENDQNTSALSSTENQNSTNIKPDDNNWVFISFASRVAGSLRKSFSTLSAGSIYFTYYVKAVDVKFSVCLTNAANTTFTLFNITSNNTERAVEEKKINQWFTQAVNFTRDMTGNEEFTINFYVDGKRANSSEDRIVWVALHHIAVGGILLPPKPTTTPNPIVLPPGSLDDIRKISESIWIALYVFLFFFLLTIAALVFFVVRGRFRARQSASSPSDYHPDRAYKLDKVYDNPAYSPSAP